jgi:uncharacterized protein YndB with AHSA1/START domain
VAERSRAVAAKDEPTIVVTRLVDAPRELVWQAWTEPRHIAQWWGPNGFTNTIHAMEVKPGGVWRFIMHGPDGTDWPNKIVYREVVRPERLVYDHSGEGANDPHRFHVTVTFTDKNGMTEIVMASLFPSLAARDAVLKFGALEGGGQTLDRLADYLPTI